MIMTKTLAVLAALVAATGSPSLLSVVQEPRRMHATGTFDVKVTPQKPDNADAQAAGVSRLALNKRFHGALDASSQGEMLAFGDGTTSGGYVAIEKLTGTLDGRTGTFALVHRALMRDGTPEGWSVTVVPGSGTGALAGIEGTMTIRIDGTKHEYAFEYTVPRR